MMTDRLIRAAQIARATGVADDPKVVPFPLDRARPPTVIRCASCRRQLGDGHAFGCPNAPA